MDPIQRKLGLIEKRLHSGNLHERIIEKSPLVFIAAGLIAGVLLETILPWWRGQEQQRRHLAIWVTFLAGCGVGSIVFFCGRRIRPVELAYSAFICFACLGALRMMSFNQAGARDIRRMVGSDSVLAEIRGVIITEPHAEKRGDWKFSRFKPTDPSSSFYLKLTEAKALEGWVRVSGTVRVAVDGPVPDLRAGDGIKAYCRLERFKAATNPGQFDTATHMARRNVYICASIKSRDGIELVKIPPAAFAAKLRRRIRETAARALLSDLPSEESGGGLLQALLLGYRGDIDSATYRAFRRTGLLHFVSLSGMHFGIVVGIVWWLSKTAGLLKRGRAVVCIAAIAVFLAVVPSRAPTVRAAIIALVLCASFLFRRRPNSINTLSLAAIILLLIRPTQLFEAGWQLSFGTVLGILLFEERIRHWVGEGVEGLAGALEYRRLRRLSKVIRAGAVIVPMLSVGLGAWLGGAGILLYHFGTITPLASLWTVAVFPLVVAILTFGFSKIIVFFLLPTLSALLGVVVGVLSEVLITAVKIIAQLDYSSISVGRVGLWIVLFYYCFIVFAIFVDIRRAAIKKAVCAGCAAILVLCIVGVKWHRMWDDELVLTCLNVGHGQAIFAEMPGGGNAFFDAGSLEISDAGRRIVGPFLDSRGIRRIETIFISHNDVDHINALPEIAEDRRIGRVVANAAFFEDAEGWGAARFLEDCLKAEGIEIERIEAGTEFGRQAVIKSIWPNKQADGEEFSENDKSLVLLVEYAGRKILLCSDIEQAAQEALLQTNPGLRADIVVVPHHGSTATTDSGFLKSLNAEVFVVSSGRRRYESRAERNGKARYFRTAEYGAVTIRISKDGTMRIETAAAGD
ncbi:MAG: DNA internalization-related competence protein ComEC/Rec2 [Sedimentisphaerales bacterium]|nr:DNA internalization-related competence protein ComEC/Rec2 [Sedimentisphaerales bacterium]